MNRDEARRFVHEALLQVVPDADLEHLADDVPLRDALELDSLDFLSFVEQLSASTGVRLDEVDYPRLTTMESGVLLLSGATAAAGGASPYLRGGRSRGRGCPRAAEP